MLRRKLMKRGLAKVMALTLAVSLAMPGTAMAAATQPPLDEATVEDVYEEDGAEEAAAADEAAEEAPTLTDEGSEVEDSTEEAPDDTEEEDTVEAEEDGEEPADAEDEGSPANTKEDVAVNEDTAADEAPADQEEEIPAGEETEAPAEQENAVEPAAASPEVNEVTEARINREDFTGILGVNNNNTYQIKVDVTYDSSTSYETNEPVYFRSDDESVVTVDSNGLVTAVGTGGAYVDVYTKTEYDDEYYDDNTWDSVYFYVYENLYSVKFDLNGGTIADDLETMDESTYMMLKNGTTGNADESIYLKTSVYKDYEYYPVAVREGYKLAGWTETKDGEDEASYYYYPSKDTTLYAKWEKVITVKFDLNGGTIADGLETEYSSTYDMYTNGTTVDEGDYVYLRTTFWKDSETEYTVVRDGYQLTGWTETKDGTEAVNYYYYPKEDVTLYAKWSKVHTVKFDLNGGKLADGLAAADESDYKMYSEGTTVADGSYVYLDTTFWDGSKSSPLAVRTGGYRFDGWTETKNGAETISYSYSPKKDVTLYAKWTQVYTVTLDPNAGTWSDSYYEREYGKGYQVEKGKSFYLPSSYALSRAGYVLLGWTTTKNGSPVLDRDYTPAKNITLYAKWAKSYKVTFNAGEGYFGSDKNAKTKVIEVASGQDIGSTPYNSSYTPRNGSKVFLGWYKDSGLKTPVKRSDTITKDTTFYAKYDTKVYKITVTNLKGAEYSNQATGEYIDEDESTAQSYSFYISQGEEIGYLSAYKDGESARFFYDKDCKTKPHYSDYVPTGDTTVYAKWNTLVTITWDAAGGQDWNGKSTGTATCKKNLMCESLPTELTKAGYYFAGWYDAADSSKKTLPASHVFKANTKVIAKWAAAIKITFKSGGGTFSPEGDPVIYIKAKTSVGEKMDFYVQRKGYTLTGWKSSVTGKVISSMYNEKPAKATTYTAVWAKETTPTTVNVTLIAGDGSLYDSENDKYVTKLVIKVPKNSTLGNASFYYRMYHDEPYKRLMVSGWSLSKNGTALKSSYTFTKDVTLYPLWGKTTYLSVALVTNGGAINNRPDNDPRVYYTVKDAMISLPTGSKIEKEGFNFIGWYTDPSFKTQVSTPDKYKVTKSCYLYAKWQALPTGENTSIGKTARGDMFNLANNVKVTWQAVPGAKYYKVYRDGVTNPAETQKEPVIVTDRLVGWDSAPGLVNGHAYRYTIVASTTGKGNSSGDSSQAYSKLMYRLKTVVIRSVKNTAAGTVTVTYDKTTAGDSYVLQYCERQDMVGAKTKVVLGAANTTYKIGGLKKGKTYYISIRVRKKVDGIDYYTTFGVAKKVTITK